MFTNMIHNHNFLQLVASDYTYVCIYMQRNTSMLRELEMTVIAVFKRLKTLACLKLGNHTKLIFVGNTHC